MTKKSVVRPKSNPKAAPAAAQDQTLAERIMNHLNGCADDVFEHNIRFLSMRQEGNVFTGMLENPDPQYRPFELHLSLDQAPQHRG